MTAKTKGEAHWAMADAAIPFLPGIRDTWPGLDDIKTFFDLGRDVINDAIPTKPESHRKENEENAANKKKNEEACAEHRRQIRYLTNDATSWALKAQRHAEYYHYDLCLKANGEFEIAKNKLREEVPALSSCQDSKANPPEDTNKCTSN